MNDTIYSKYLQEHNDFQCRAHVKGYNKTFIKFSHTTGICA